MGNIRYLSMGSEGSIGVFTMHARPEIRTILIAKKLKRWTLIAKYPAVYPGYSPARARRNYWRLCAKYPEIMAMLNLNELSVYEL